MFDVAQLATFAELQSYSLGLVETAEPLCAETHGNETKDSRHARIMIVDDELINIEVVKAYLEEEGFFNFLTTTRSTIAVDMVRNEKPDIVLLDINMPQVSGLDILRSDAQRS